MSITPQEHWMQICQKLKNDLGEEIFMSWIAPLSLLKADEHFIVFRVPSIFMRNWVLTHYADTILSYWKKIFPCLQTIDFNVDVASAEVVDSKETADVNLRLDERFTFENFVVGKPNELAYAAAQRVAECGKPPFNPLFLYGGVGLGKTHLMHAISWKVKNTKSDKRVIYMSAEKFMYEFVKAVRYKNTDSFKERFRSVDLLMIDDVQFIGGKDTTQEEFFHTFNALVDNNRQIIVSADKSPADLEKMEDRLKSRLGWGLVADIHPTTYELRLSILQSKAEQIGIFVPEDVLEFLALKISSNVRELEGALNRVAAHTVLVKRPVTLDLVQAVLKDLLKNSDRYLTIDDIQRRVCEYYSLRLSELLSRNRVKTLARPRQIAMFLCKELTGKSFPDIGRKFAGRDHTTILHACRNISDLCAKDKEIETDIRTLKTSLEGRC